MVFGLNMTAFVQGTFEEAVENRRLRNAQEAETAKLLAENTREDAKALQTLIQEGVTGELLTPAIASQLSAAVSTGAITEPARILAAFKTIDDIDNKTFFGQGPNAVSFGWNYSDDTNPKNIREKELNSYTTFFNSPRNAAQKLDEFTANPDAGRQFVETIRGLRTNYASDFYFDKSGKDDSGQITVPAYATFAANKNLFNFVDTLAQNLGMDVNSEYENVMANAKIANGNNALSSTQIIVPTVSAENSQSFKIINLSQEEATAIDTLAKNHGLVDRNHFMARLNDFSYTGDTAINTTNMLNGTLELALAKAPDMLLGAGPADPEVPTKVADILHKYVPDRNLGAQMQLVLPLIAAENAKKLEAVDFGQITGKQYLELQGKDPEGISTSNTFAEQSVGIIDQLITNYNAKDAVLTGFAGILQRFRLGIFGDGGQIDQMFRNLDEEKDLEEGTTKESLRQIVIDSVNKYEGNISEAGRIGETEVLTVQLAYAMARSVDSNGRLSDSDFRIQMEQLGATGFFTNTNVTIFKLNTLKKQFNQRVEDTQFFVNMLDKNIGKDEIRQFLAYDIIEQSNKINRSRDTSTPQASITRAYLQNINNAEVQPIFIQPNRKFYRVNNTQKLYVVNEANGQVTFIPDMYEYSRENDDFTMKEGVDMPVIGTEVDEPKPKANEDKPKPQPSSDKLSDIPSELQGQKFSTKITTNGRTIRTYSDGTGGFRSFEVFNPADQVPYFREVE
tara:strand:- start:36 stop:2240 length:2205 start_codon:yes stop_codon:yes gene_type:complete